MYRIYPHRYRNVGGLIGKKINTSQSIVADDIRVAKVKFRNGYYSGGLIGWLEDGSLYGYNVLLDDLTYENYNSSNKLQAGSNGRIIGKKKTDTGRIIRLTGFSQQGTVSRMPLKTSLIV